MSAFRSALYAGKVMHQRMRPRKHRLSYRIFQMLFDLDEIDALDARLKLFSRNRFNLFSFFDADHGNGGGTSLKAYVADLLAASGIETDGGPVRLLCMPRILGYVFNPLSVYFCYRRDASLAAILYEVNNTFGQRHSYLIPVETSAPGAPIEQRCGKDFYVSPFIAMDLDYRFRVVAPQDGVSVHITASDTEGPLIFAAFSGSRRPFRDAELARALVVYPLLTVKVVAGIHWEALLLWIKGTRLQPRPAPPSEPVTHVATQATMIGRSN